MKKQTAIIFYILVFYVVVQFSWWGYHLIELTEELTDAQTEINRRIVMILGEGLVFFLILLIGFWKIRSSIKKELRLKNMQNNFLLSITHELKTPVAANKLFLQTIQKHPLSEEKRKELLQKSLDETLRLEKLVNNILNASQLENRSFDLHRETISVVEFIQAIVARFEKQFPKTTFHFSHPKELSANVDVFLLEAIVNNLLDNAQKYGSGKVIVQLEAGNDAKFKLTISDNGKGISSEELPFVFKKFYRSGNEAKRTQKGSGLGLFIANEFTKLHQGELRYLENESSGASFALTL